MRCMIGAFVLTLLVSVAIAQTAAPEEAIDFVKARELLQRSQRGETLSAEDQAYLDMARQLRRQRAQDAPAAVAPTPAASVGLTPMTDGAAEAAHKGMPLGLYGDGRNDPPVAHAAQAKRSAAEIIPRRRDGSPSPDGKIVLLSVGMSNTTQAFSAFVRLASADEQLSPDLIIVHGAQGGQAADAWSSPERTATWEQAERRLQRSGATPEQVQVIWIKQALRGPHALGAFPDHARQLQDHLRRIIIQAKRRYPNLKLVYLSSRTYGGWATTPLNPEPYAYESAFAVQWLIREQADGTTPELAYDKAPVLLWGPYLWADGTMPRADGLTWEKTDISPDGTHPSDAGRGKVARQLLHFFKSDPTSRTWFVR